MGGGEEAIGGDVGGEVISEMGRITLRRVL
jgi:hypothetical protein